MTWDFERIKQDMDSATMEVQLSFKFIHLPIRPFSLVFQDFNPDKWFYKKWRKYTCESIYMCLVVYYPLKWCGSSFPHTRPNKYIKGFFHRSPFLSKMPTFTECRKSTNISHECGWMDGTMVCCKVQWVCLMLMFFNRNEYFRTNIVCS